MNKLEFLEKRKESKLFKIEYNLINFFTFGCYDIKKKITNKIKSEKIILEEQKEVLNKIGLKICDNQEQFEAVQKEIINKKNKIKTLEFEKNNLKDNKLERSNSKDLGIEIAYETKELVSEGTQTDSSLNIITDKFKCDKYSILKDNYPDEKNLFLEKYPENLHPFFEEIETF